MERTEQDLQSRKMIWDTMSHIMATGGFFDSIYTGGKELERMKHFLDILRGEESDPRLANPPSPTDPDPWILPLFPEIRNVPFPDPADFDWVPVMERGYEKLREEGHRLRDSFMTMSYASSDEKQEAKWRQGFVSAFGTPIPHDFFPPGMRPDQVFALLHSLPNEEYAGFSHFPFADALYSWLDPNYKVPAHYSADNFRIRCQLGLSIPEDCYIRVAGESRTWEEGKALLLDDSFYHDAANNSDEHRLIFYTDFWNPDFTLAERRALRAAFGKKEIRLLVLHMRELPQNLIDQFMPLFSAVDEQDEAIASHWSATPDTSQIPDVIARIRQLHMEAAQAKSG